MTHRFKVFVPLVLISMLVGGGLTYAATNYYADLVTNQKEQIQKELEQAYEERQAEIGKQVHNDMVMYASTSRDAMVERLKKYMNEKLNQEPQDRMNKHSAEIDKAVSQLEKELEKYIDNLGDGKK